MWDTVRREFLGGRAQLAPRLFLVQLACSLLPDFAFSVVRARLYALAGMRVAHDVAFVGKVRFVYASGARVGERFVVQPGAVLSARILVNLDDTVTIERNASIGPEVSIYTSEHEIGPGWQRMRPDIRTRPVTIEEGAWVGARAVILPGVRIGRGSIVAAGSVVTRDVPPDTVVRGNPATPVRDLEH